MTVILGMDVGGSSIKVGAWRDGQRLAWRDGLPVPATADEGLLGHAFEDYVRGVADELPEPPAGLGIGSCGLIAGGNIFQSPNTPWDRLPLQDMLQTRLGYPAYLINDADAFLISGLTTLVEPRCVALGVTLGTGIGTALWFHDVLFCGGAGVSPEGGHITLGIDRAPGNTGIPGTWESLAGKYGLMRHYGEAGGDAHTEPPEIARRARQGEPAAIAAWVRYGRYVGAGLGSLCNVVSPDYVLIGGGMAKSHDLFETAMHAALGRHMLAAMPRPDITFLDDRDDTVAHGAMHYAALKLGLD